MQKKVDGSNHKVNGIYPQLQGTHTMIKDLFEQLLSLRICRRFLKFG